MIGFIQMRNRYYVLLTGALALAGYLTIQAPAHSEPDPAQMAAESRALVKSFAGELKGQLVGAIKTGGPVSAIPLCHIAAPAIAHEKAVEKGWSVGRTALKLRNPANSPDAWERAVLDKFLKQAKQGGDLAKLEHYETTENDGKRVFRYMKAIPTGEPCLTCHGAGVKADLKAKIREFYPQDKATGFALGDLRGAFTITQPLN